MENVNGNYYFWSRGYIRADVGVACSVLALNPKPLTLNPKLTRSKARV